jgi:uncharacterized SAM-binding protein YcdF (DUF218 family)
VIAGAVELLKLIARPASLSFVMLAVIVGVVLLFVRRTARIARWYFVAFLVLYTIAATPACSERLIMWIGSGYQPLKTVADARGAKVVVVLGAGNETFQARGLTYSEVSRSAVFRLLEGVRLYRLLDRPTLIVSGGITGRDEGARPEGEAMRNVALDLGVPADRILVEAESKNTREEAIVIKRMLGQQPGPIVLVTSPTHMARSLAVFRTAGFDPIPSVAPYKSDHALEHYRWLPNDLGIWLFDMVVYDAAATLYYRARGWID